jgi:hypothetical protein
MASATAAAGISPSARNHSTSELTMPKISLLTSSGGRSSRIAPSAAAARTSWASCASIQRRRASASFSTALLPRTRSSKVTAGWCAARTTALRRTTDLSRAYAVPSATLPPPSSSASRTTAVSSSSASSRAWASRCSLLGTWW